MSSSYGEAPLELPVDEWVDPVWEGDEWHPSEDEEEIPVGPGCREGSKDDLEGNTEEED